MTDCPDGAMRDLLPEYLHDGVDARRRAAVAAHLAGCADCRAELAMLDRARRALARAPELDLERIAAAVVAARPARAARPRIVDDVRGSGGAWTRSHAWRAAAAVLLVAGVTALPFLLREPPPGAPSERGDTVAVGGAPAVAGPPQITFGSGISELDEAALETLIREMDAVEALPHADPAPLLSVDPLGDAGAD